MNILFTLLLLLAALAAVFACAWHWNRSAQTPARSVSTLQGVRRNRLKAGQRTSRGSGLAARLQLRSALFMRGLIEALVLPFRNWQRWKPSRPHRPIARYTAEFANIAEGTRPSGSKTYLADGAITTRYLCVKLGSDLNHIAICTAITDNPIGLNADEPAAAEDECNVQLFGASTGTLRVVSGAAITVGNYVATMANGKVQPAVATQFAIGRALNAAAGADELIEIDPIRSDRVL